MIKPLKILAIDPSDLSIPYVYLSEHYTLNRVMNVALAMKECLILQPDIVLISSTLSPNDMVQMLEAVKNTSAKKLIPIVFVVNFNHRIILLPGTTWASHIGLFHNFSSPTEVEATFIRLLAPSEQTPRPDATPLLELLKLSRTSQPIAPSNQEPAAPEGPEAPEASKAPEETESPVETEPASAVSTTELNLPTQESEPHQVLKPTPKPAPDIPPSPPTLSSSPSSSPPFIPSTNLKPLKPLSHFHKEDLKS